MKIHNTFSITNSKNSTKLNILDILRFQSSITDFHWPSLNQPNNIVLFCQTKKNSYFGPFALFWLNTIWINAKKSLCVTLCHVLKEDDFNFIYHKLTNFIDVYDRPITYFGNCNIFIIVCAFLVNTRRNHKLICLVISITNFNFCLHFIWITNLCMFHTYKLCFTIGNDDVLRRLYDDFNRGWRWFV